MQISMNVLKFHVIKTAPILLAPLIVHVTMGMCWMRMVGVVMVCTRVDDYQLFTTIQFVYRY